jgi:hypothetical protein
MFKRTIDLKVSKDMLRITVREIDKTLECAANPPFSHGAMIVAYRYRLHTLFKTMVETLDNGRWFVVSVTVNVEFLDTPSDPQEIDDIRQILTDCGATKVNLIDRRGIDKADQG